MQPYAEKLAGLLPVAELSSHRTDNKRVENEAVDIGTLAWQIGGLNCMRQLHSMTTELCRERCRDSMVVDYVSAWWDGIGSWRNPSLG